MRVDLVLTLCPELTRADLAS